MHEVKIGCFGMQGHQILSHIPSLKRARLTALGKVGDEQYASLRENLQGMTDVPLFSDFDSFLAEADCDLVSICSTPRADQYNLVVQALRAGKHVLAEKPMALNLSDLDALRKVMEESGMELRTMTPMAYEPHYTAMRNAVRSGKLGEVVQVYAMKSYPYNDSRPQDRREDGGLIRQAGIHAVSIARYITGLEFTEVFAHDTGAGNPKDGELQLGANVTFRLSNGAVMALLCNYCNPPGIGFHGNDQIRIHGMKGMIESVDGGTRHVLATSGSGLINFDGESPPVEYPQDFINCLLDGTPTLLSAEDSFRNTEAVIRAQDSADTGKVVSFP